MSRRTERLASTIREELATIIMRELNDPRLVGLPSITRVKVTDDLSIADVYVTVMGTEGQQTAAINALKHAAGLMRTKLTKVLTLRVAPYLKFHMDENLKKELAMMDLLRKVSEENSELDRQRAAGSRPRSNRDNRPNSPTIETSMKNATKHADDLKSLFKKLLKEGKPEPRPAMEPVDALVRGAMSYDVTDVRAEDAMKVIGKEFVDLNELRVATDLEIQEMLGVKYPAIEQRVAMITLSLNDIFEREHTLNLDRLKTVSKRDARQFLRELPEIHPFVEAYVMLMSLDGHAMPVDEEILAIPARRRDLRRRDRRWRMRRNFWSITSKPRKCMTSSCSPRQAAQSARPKRR